MYFEFICNDYLLVFIYLLGNFTLFVGTTKHPILGAIASQAEAMEAMEGGQAHNLPAPVPSPKHAK